MRAKYKYKIFTTVTISILLLCLSILSNSTKVKTVDSYLYNNYKTTDFTEQGIGSALRLIDDSNRYNLFFTGEYHTIPGNETISLEVLKYLNKATDVNYLICEVQYSVINKLNKYIQNGDEELLNEAVNVIRKSDAKYANENYYKFWQGLYEYNKGLHNDKKIQVFGIDVDFNGDYTLKEMVGLIPPNEPTAEIANQINKFKELFSNEIPDEQEVVTALKNLKDDFGINESVYKAFFGDNFNDFKINLFSMINTVKYAETQDGNRDALIYDNFMRIYNQNPKGKYYGQFGANHIFREDIISEGKAFYTLAKMLEKKNNFKVLSIPIVPSDRMNLISQGEKLASGRFTIFKLNGKGSLFTEQSQNIFANNGFGLANGTTVDNYQYVIYLKRE
jgi:hypothetical protein